MIAISLYIFNYIRSYCMCMVMIETQCLAQKLGSWEIQLIHGNIFVL